MNYYLRTLEGVGRCFGGVLFDEFYKIVSRLKSVGTDLKDAAFSALVQMRDKYPNSDFSEIYAAIDERYKSEPYNYKKVYEGKNAFIINESRKRQAAQASAQASEQARAMAQAKEEAERAEMEARRAAAARMEEEEAAAQAAAEIAQYEALRDEIANNINYIENGQMILTTPEALQVYKELTGRDYSEILARDEEAAAVYESEVKKMSEEEKTQMVEISPVVINSEHEYSIIDEDDKTITYQDETGMIHIEPKASVAPWLILAGAAAALALV